MNERMFRAEAASILSDQIERLQSDTYRLRVPATAVLMRREKGRHFHIVPELVVQLEGQAVLELPDGRLTLDKGDICLIPRGVPHRERVVSRRGAFRNLVGIPVQSAVCFHVGVAGPDDGPAVEPGLCQPLPDAQRVFAFADDIATLYRSRSVAAQATTRGLLLAMLGTLVLGLTSPASNPVCEHFKVSQCRQLMGSHLGDPALSVKYLAARLHCSADYLSHLFHANTGTRLSASINLQRINQAQYLLKQSSMNVAEIGHSCGYADPSYFARVFRRLTGCTPLAFRRNAALWNAFAQPECNS
ncbi:MAG: helix-turn-helix domain-containing protein [Lentisphaerae bacterium]|nr:helix-turn-helix domain-containing protein [Lentisphaerota bacterium]